MKQEHFDAIVHGLEEAVRFARGEDAPGMVVHYRPKEEVPAIRAKSGLTQAEFAARIGVSTATLRNWEQGRRQPDGPARVLLAMLAKDPDIVGKTLGKRAA